MKANFLMLIIVMFLYSSCRHYVSFEIKDVTQKESFIITGNDVGHLKIRINAELNDSFDLMLNYNFVKEYDQILRYSSACNEYFEHEIYDGKCEITYVPSKKITDGKIKIMAKID